MTPTKRITCRSVNVEADKKRLARAMSNTHEDMIGFDQDTVSCRAGQVVDYNAPALNLYVAVCLDSISGPRMAALEAFRARTGKRVIARVYQDKSGKPMSVEVFPPTS